MNDEIMREFKDKAVIDWNEIMFHEHDAIQIIQKCQKLNKKILGIEAFRIMPQGIQPMDYFDYTARFYADFEPSRYFEMYHVKKYTDIGHWTEAIQFIKDRIGRGWLFEIDYDRS
jgi:hypothetical protein